MVPGIAREISPNSGSVMPLTRSRRGLALWTAAVMERRKFMRDYREVGGIPLEIPAELSRPMTITMGLAAQQSTRGLAFTERTRYVHGVNDGARGG